jgi:hypothetical protein
MRTFFAWLVPDVAMVAAGVTLFYCLFLFQGYQKLFRDSDAGWHIRNGEAILATGQLPRTDPYSFTRAGQPWFAWEWLADVVAGAADRAGGLSGVALLYASLIAAATWLWFRLHWALHGNFLLACAMAPLMLSTSNIHWLARPHVFGWLFLLAAVLWAERHPTDFTLRDAALVAAFTALWANMHGSFFLAPAIALIYAAGAWLRRVIWNSSGADALVRAGPPGPALPYLYAAAISALAALANPYGWRLWDHIFRYLTDSALLARIGEFQSFNFHAAGAAQIIATLLLGCAGGTLALSRRRPEHFLLAILFTAMALRSARALPLAALLLLPIANAAITESLAHAAGLTRRLRAALDGFFAYSGRLRKLDSQFSGLPLAPLFLLACFALLRTPSIRAATGFSPAQFPVAAYPHIPAGARLYAPDKYGGYLIYRSAGKRKVFFDGRSDLYGAAFLENYARLIQLRPGWRAYWDSFSFTDALVPADSPLAAALRQAGWKTVYSDKTAVLLAAGGT